MAGLGPEWETINLEDGWAFIEMGIAKLVNTLERNPDEQPFNSEGYLMLYTTIYHMCNPPHYYRQQLYDRYREAFQKYITETVLPAIKEKHDEFMLRELVQRWSNHQIMVRLLSHIFHYLDQTFVTPWSLTSLRDVGLICFRDLMSEETKGKIKDAVIHLIDQEREGEQIDKALLSNVQDICVEIGLTIV